MAMAEMVTVQHRMNAIQTFWVVKQLLGAVNLANDDDVDHDRRLFTSFAMNLEQFGYKAARVAHMPPGYFLSVLPNILCVSQNLGKGVGYCELLYIYRLLGETKFNRIAKVHGLQTPTPFRLEYGCPGTPSVGTSPAVQCQAVRDESGNFPPISMIGAETPGHPFWGNFACSKCSDRYRALSRKKLQLMIENNEELTEDQLRLHKTWEAGRADHAAYVAKMEQQNMQSNPEETMAANRMKTRRNIIKRKKRAPTKSKKKSGFDRRNRSPKLHYNPRFTKMLRLMVTTLIDTVGLPVVSSFLLNSVYTELVEEELKADRSVGFKMGIPTQPWIFKKTISSPYK